MTDHVQGAGQRLMQIQFAFRNGRWWEARELLPDAERHEDWRSLGYASWDDYLQVALTHPRNRHKIGS